MIYFDSAATSLHKPEAMLRAFADAVSTFGGAGRGAHPAALAAARAIYRARVAAAGLFGCNDPGRVAFAANATQALNTAICGALTPQDHVISTVMEHNSVLRPLYRLQEQGMGLTLLPVDEKGVLAPGAFAAALRPDTRAVVCTHASNLTGNVNDAAAIGRFCREHNLLFILDAAQTAGALPIDMNAMNIDVLCFTGHKSLLGPQGTGGLAARPGVAIRPLLSGGSGVHSFSKTQPEDMPESLEAGTQNAHGLAALAASIAYVREMGVDAIMVQEAALARRFYQGVAGIPGIVFYGDYEAPVRAPIVTLNIGDEDSAAVGDWLSEEYGICTRPGAHCAPLLHEALGTHKRGAVRFSFSHFNTVEEVDCAVAALQRYAKERRA